MIQLGITQDLYMVKRTDFGIYLAEGPREDAEDKVLLPLKQVPADMLLGNQMSVFVYRDSKDRLIATVNTPKLHLGEVAELTVVEVNQVGAFLDWGLEKDLLLPFHEQTKKVAAGDTCLAALYIDKSGRLCATMNVYPYLKTDSPYHKDDSVQGCVYEMSREFGAFVAVDNVYSGLIPQRELYGTVEIGDVITARVSEVKEDGKLDLSIRDKAYLQMDTDAALVMEAMIARGGVLPFTDKADPSLIKEELQMSKNGFKRAVGRLLKENKIQINESNITIK
ncbi:MAG: S1-like domain-containing RNA-binding protein [Lachnospiraceae bacterium]